ncbi:hypothetical protein CERSUDRAFT_95916 [Gelatoporia subvermispora B]|uniref:Uncharacterized protein n=1 Tax=Ceriporiopsis subvermispora (strain B) TaxID=914234 RepID=M2QHV9_CERS8|nr:hypothetical protein CERSUDRAFT_95916 [Gelatoporia subvermispora B]
MRLAPLIRLERLRIDLRIDGTNTGPSNALPVFMSELPVPNVKELDIAYDYEPCQRRQFGVEPQEGAFSTPFARLDSVLDSSRFQHLKKVEVELRDLLPEDAECISILPSQRFPFPALRARRLLKLTVMNRRNRKSVTVIPFAT